MRKSLIFSSIYFLLHLLNFSRSVRTLPLSTNSRWILNEKGKRVKLACVNWMSHIDTVVAEGLNKQAVDVISLKIKNMGFNCVRLTWPLYLATNQSLASLSVNQSLTSFGLGESIAGLQANNPSFLNISLIDAFQAVVASLAKNKVMVILDNHISKPGWCCSEFDGNGFFGDQYFDTDLWIKGLIKMATLFKNNPHVVGMSLRNELRGPNQTQADWYRYMSKGGEAVHGANPNILVILSGLKSSRDLSFLRKKPVKLTFSTRKLVFEMHWYAITKYGITTWIDGNLNEVCNRIVSDNMEMAGFVLGQGYPLFVGEVGIDLRGISVNDNRFFNCFIAWAAQYDVDWAWWTLTGSNYIRQGVIGIEEVYGVLDYNWCHLRNASFLDRISVLQSPLQGPGLAFSKPHKIILHPFTGHCILTKSPSSPLSLGNCSESDHWSYTNDKVLTIKGTYFCLEAQGIGRPVRLGIICPGRGTTWDLISDSKHHLSTTLVNNTRVCLDVDSNDYVITTTCKCLTLNHMCDPASQWFMIIDSNKD